MFLLFMIQVRKGFHIGDGKLEGWGVVLWRLMVMYYWQIQDANVQAGCLEGICSPVC